MKAGVRVVRQLMKIIKITIKVEEQKYVKLDVITIWENP